MAGDSQLMTDGEYLAYTGETVSQAWERVHASGEWKDEVERQRRLAMEDGWVSDDGTTPEERADWLLDPVADAWDRKKREERRARPDWYESLPLTQDQARLAEFGITEVEGALRRRMAVTPDFTRSRYGWWTKDPHDWLEYPFFTSNEGASAAFENSVFSIHAYDWGEDEDGFSTNGRNFVFKPLDAIFDWYKYVGRDFTANAEGKKVLEEGAFWETVISPCLASVSDGDGITHDVLVPEWNPANGRDAR